MRPDMGWLYSVVSTMEAHPGIRQHLRLIANPAAFPYNGRVYLREAVGGGRAITNISIRSTAPVRRILAAARLPIPHHKLLEMLLAEVPEATLEKVTVLVSDLWEQGFLLTDLRPPLTAPSPAGYVAERLRAIPAADGMANQIEAILDSAEAWSKLSNQEAEPEYRRLVSAAKSISRAAGDSPFQVDCSLSIHGGSLARNIAAEAARAAELLLQMTPWPSGIPYLEAYRNAFVTRYGHAREVPLLKLLDPEYGLGPPGWPGTWMGIPPKQAAKRAQTQIDLALSAIRSRQLAIQLTEEDLKNLNTWSNTTEAPGSLDLYVLVAAPSERALDAGEFEIVVGPNLGAMAAGRNLSRFAEGLSAEAKAFLEHAARAEENASGDRIWAELLYVPNALHAANVVVRPCVRKYQIPVGVAPTVEPDRVIPLDELNLGVCGNRFRLRWVRHNLEVIVCSGHMLNSTSASAVCRFLADLDRDGMAQLSGFDWGPASGFPFLPRVQMGRAVLSVAQWRLDSSARTRAFGRANTLARFGESLRLWRAEWQVPRYVYLCAGDNRLLLDLEKVSQQEHLWNDLKHARESTVLLLQEMYPSFDGMWLRGPDGHYAAELVVSAVRRRQTEPSRPAQSAAAPLTLPASDKRFRPPGSEWLFIKLYGPRSFEDDLITERLMPFATYLTSSGLVEDWFYLRYADPEPHLRIRFLGDPSRMKRELISTVCDWAAEAVASGLSERFTLDTYDRELERFGGVAATAVAEQLFGADTRMVAELLHLVRTRAVRLDQTILAVLGIDSLLGGLGLDSTERLRWYRSSVNSRQETGAEYRNRKNFLRTFLALPEALEAQFGGAQLMSILARRAAALERAADRLAKLAAKGQLAQHRFALYASYIHLHCNRLAGTDPSLERRALGLLLRTRESLANAPVMVRFPIDDSQPREG
jgi:thiopeptide-type bacteriocin biosynthesis protein